MKKVLFFAMVLGVVLCSCNRNKNAAKELLTQLKAAQASKNVDAVKRLYPGAEGVDSLFLNFDVEKLTFKQFTDTLVADDGAGHYIFFSTKNSDNITIINSKGVFVFPQYRMRFAKGTGQYKEGILDVELAKRMNDRAFDDYVLQKLRLKYANPLSVGNEIYDNYEDMKWYVPVTNHSDITLRSTDYDLQYKSSYYDYSNTSNYFDMPNIKTKVKTQQGFDIAPGQTVKFPFWNSDSEWYENFTIHYHISDATLMEAFQPTGREYEDYLAANGGVHSGKNQATLVGHKTLKGNIGNNAVNGTIDFTPDNTFTGAYGYKGRTTGIDIKGTITIDGQVVASETNAQGEVCGNYRGRVTGNIITGQFTNYKGKQFNFTWNIQ